MKVSRIGIVAALAVWGGLIASGVGVLYAYEGTPGAHAETPASWPAASTLPHDGITVAMFVHPECPCTRASISELATVLHEAPRPQTLLVVVDGDPSELGDRLRELGAVRVVADREGVEAVRFGAKTSGHVVAYDAHGALAFSGGITPARGHVGDNMGRRNLERVLAGSAPDDARHAVLGCALEAR